MKLFLVTWPHTITSGKDSQFIGGDLQWDSFSNMKIKLRILISYWYYKDINLDEVLGKYFTGNYPEIFADSGAFSAMTQNGNVNIDDYNQWIKKYKHLFSVYSNLDIIKDAPKTLYNQKYMEDAGLEPLPVFHVLEDWKDLEYYIDNYQYIALGVAGMQNRKDAIMGWLTRCFELAREKSVYHGFGLTSWKVMSSFPWYSVDSSSWGQGFRYGAVPIFDYSHGKFYKPRLGNKNDWIKVDKIVREMGFDPLDFMDRSRNDRQKICAISALSYINAERWLQNKTKIYLVSGGESSIDAPLGGNMSIKALSGIKIYLTDSNGDGGGI